MLQGFWPITMGTLIGLAAALVLERTPVAVSARQLNLSPSTFSDPMFYGELALMVAIAVLASVVPARRAMRVDPVVALRHE